MDYFNTGYTTENRKPLFDQQVLFWLNAKPFIIAITGYRSSYDNGTLKIDIENIETNDGMIKISEVI